jgi:hypothetical protein
MLEYIMFIWFDKKNALMIDDVLKVFKAILFKYIF